MNDHTKSVGDIFAFNSTMIRLGLEDLSNDDATHQVRGGEGSSISFLAGHLMASRVGALQMLGLETENPFSDLFGGSAAAQNGSAYPDISELAASWDQLSEKFEAALAGLTDDDVLQPSDGFPVPDQTVRGGLMFLASHESYHAGQIGAIRTELGYSSFQARLSAERQSA